MKTTAKLQEKAKQIRETLNNLRHEISAQEKEWESVTKMIEKEETRILEEKYDKIKNKYFKYTKTYNGYECNIYGYVYDITVDAIDMPNADANMFLASIKYKGEKIENAYIETNTYATFTPSYCASQFYFSIDDVVICSKEEFDEGVNKIKEYLTQIKI